MIKPIPLKFKFLLYWGFPVLLALCFEVLFADFRPFRWWNVLENSIFAFGMLLSLSFFNSVKIKSFLANFYYLFFLFSLFFESVFYALFSTDISPSAVFILIETNADEAVEFLQFYLNFSTLLFLFSFIGLGIFYVKQSKKALFNRHSRLFKVYLSLVFLGLLSTLKFTGLIDTNWPYLVGRSVLIYAEEQQKMAASEIDAPLGYFRLVKHHTKSDKSLYVLVIGESTTRNHLGLYGYSRKTTPKLAEIKAELLLYQNVISAHAFTIGALKGALTWHGFTKTKESSVVQLMNQAGFKTYWFSNQRPLGPYESLVTRLSQASDVVRFTNSGVAGGMTPYDTDLWPYLDRALADSADKKFIVLHLLGTHMEYQNRYPERFDYFSGQPQSQFSTDLAMSRINAYDNAVRYMDFFLRKVIEKVRKQNQSSYVLYFSDHGEEVYQDRYFAGHVEANPTQNMFEIPFFLWQSKKFKAAHKIDTVNLGKSYVTDDFLFSLADLSQIDFKGMDASKSIFSESFLPKERIVGRGLNFDVYFNKKGIN